LFLSITKKQESNVMVAPLLLIIDCNCFLRCEVFSRNLGYLRIKRMSFIGIFDITAAFVLNVIPHNPVTCRKGNEAGCMNLK